MVRRIDLLVSGYLALWLERLTPDQEDMSSNPRVDRLGTLTESGKTLWSFYKHQIIHVWLWRRGKDVRMA
jgi:hypothetical protein